MPENLLQTFYTIYLQNPAYGLGFFFLIHRIFYVKYAEFMYHFGCCFEYLVTFLYSC